ncbi:uronyl 2-sulfotransferase-like [Microplitis mediator]|uniref:uronyl 2-sulfotransferase-like n=1 Tax=Microplitis mediator TaxID=375433 RepID=UPI002554840D|nr:uronyl 2-sulfotransferase-like [Microplitis mediator]
MRRVKSLLIISIIFTVLLLVYNMNHQFINDMNYSNYYAQTVHRMVTPSLAELGTDGISKFNDHVIMLTRVPGAGAEILVYILQHLSGYNAFKHIRIPSGNYDKILSPLQQEFLVEDITDIIKQEAIPLSFDGNIRFLNFSKFGRQTPSFISIVRDPRDIYLSNRNKSAIYDGGISYFCGQNPRCAVKNRWSLENAKKNVMQWYSVIGILENMEETLNVLTKKFHYFFNGASDIYIKKFRLKKMLRNNKIKRNLLIKKKIEKTFEREIEFYLWLKSRLLNQADELIN